MPDFHHIAILVKPGDSNIAAALNTLLPLLESRDRQVLLDQSTEEYLHLPYVEREQLATQADLAIVIGGDGTLLDAARALADAEVPILGVNLGRLGFLVDVLPRDMESRLDDVLNGRFREAKRFMLEANIIRDGQVLGSWAAFNDVVVSSHEVVRMIEFETRVNGNTINTQRADGIVVSTPTGSTAYALSAGGPILHPKLDALAIVPVCPHTLSNRPVVVSGDSLLDIRITDNCRIPAQASFDGQSNYALQAGDVVSIRKKEPLLRLLHPDDYDYFQVLRQKLRWAEQP